MSSMSRNNSAASLMGFSVHQPAIGASLQFFPAMGSQELDDLINAYVPGDASILDKRAVVSMEFFQHSMLTGELFKFFMVYPSLGSATESPASSSAVMDSGYGSAFTSPVMSESQWAQTANAASSSQPKARSSSSKKNTALASDFSHIPGMKIMTKDGRDVTNSASRVGKTKEQRDHAHLMRIIKACEACKKKKIRCDPSHKRSAPSSSSKKATKKAKSGRPAAAPPQQPVTHSSSATSFDSFMEDSSSSFGSLFPETLGASDVGAMDWEQFVQYEDQPSSVPIDYDFFLDPAGYFSPANSATHTSSTSPLQPITPVQPMVSDAVFAAEGVLAGTTAGAEAQGPFVPYLNPGGVEAGTNYADFNLYSPGSSTYLDEEPGLMKEMAASPRPNYSEYLSNNRHGDGNVHAQSYPSQVAANIAAAMRPDVHAANDPVSSSSPYEMVFASGNDRSLHDRSDHRPSSSRHLTGGDASQAGVVTASLQTPVSRERLGNSAEAVLVASTGRQPQSVLLQSGPSVSPAVLGVLRSEPCISRSASQPETGAATPVALSMSTTARNNARSQRLVPDDLSVDRSPIDTGSTRATARLQTSAEVAYSEASSRQASSSPLAGEFAQGEQSTRTSSSAFRTAVLQSASDASPLAKIQTSSQDTVSMSASPSASLSQSTSRVIRIVSTTKTTEENARSTRVLSTSNAAGVSMLPVSAAVLKHSSPVEQIPATVISRNSRNVLAERAPEALGLLAAVSVSDSLLSATGTGLGELSQGSTSLGLAAVALPILAVLGSSSMRLRCSSNPSLGGMKPQQSAGSSSSAWTIAVALMSSLIIFIALAGSQPASVSLGALSFTVAAHYSRRQQHNSTTPNQLEPVAWSPGTSLHSLLSFAVAEATASFSAGLDRVRCWVLRRISPTPPVATGSASGNRSMPTTLKRNAQKDMRRSLLV
ncbi:Uu.00g109930.m01.CDS01 [Anthostomella pinea]|uniref:Uu.00g109930.m01.CDS01 n=1 Tax=Anthostomella pinea TaxID=933095 RepID=A0AAI8YG47_9PEZI|nr:Uu.00g109930.m01.CDS01 [Anthostomella pinea]